MAFVGGRSACGLLLGKQVTDLTQALVAMSNYILMEGAEVRYCTLSRLQGLSTAHIELAIANKKGRAVFVGFQIFPPRLNRE
jgi:hypothetical protein